MMWRAIESRTGVVVTCTVCGDTKKPVGRSGPLGASYCDDDCPGYRQEPYPGSLWPGETSEDFGYPVGGINGTEPTGGARGGGGTMTQQERDQLRQLAERATPGPWKHVGGPLRRKVFTSPINEVVAPDIEQVVVAWPGFDGVEDAAANAAYIAAAHPQAVLEEMAAHDALVARVAELEHYEALVKADAFQQQDRAIRTAHGWERDGRELPELVDALAARVRELEAERTSLVQHAQHYLPSWGTPQANEYSTQGEHERTWLIGAFNHLGSVRETLSAVVQSRDALAARVAELEPLATGQYYDRAIPKWQMAITKAEQEKDALAAENRALRAKLAEAAPYTCPECGPHVKVDEDECCAACGLDAILTATRPPEAHERRPLNLDVSREWCIAAAEAEAGHDVSAGRPSEAPESSIVATLPPGTTHGDFTDCPFCGQECVPVPHTCPAPEAERKRHHHETWCQSFYMANEPAQNTGPFGGYPCNCKEAPKGGPR